eukprot:scaffold57442_cov70-Phaeocystis_antarctica.AAC.3
MASCLGGSDEGATSCAAISTAGGGAVVAHAAEGGAVLRRGGLRSARSKVEADDDVAVVRVARALEALLAAAHLARLRRDRRRPLVEGLQEGHVQHARLEARVADDAHVEGACALVRRGDGLGVHADEVVGVADAGPAAIVHRPGHLARAVDALEAHPVAGRCRRMDRAAADGAVAARQVQELLGSEEARTVQQEARPEVRGRVAVAVPEYVGILGMKLADGRGAPGRDKLARDLASVGVHVLLERE